MSWAAAAIERLQRGETVTIRPRGHSMAGKVNDGDRVIVAPIAERELVVGEFVLVRVRGRIYRHLIKLIKAKQGERRLIGNNRGGVNGWVGPHAVYGVAVNVEAGPR